MPEVYLNAALFSVTGPSVVALKATTLACFVLLRVLAVSAARGLVLDADRVDGERAG